ncbi:MAG: hypothetical protein A2V91_04265 [Candidatus Muproteobacteria bacterium RBG_16_64_10]|uniref:POTRA domain-containing protein n=1 Tax=Candidatus Muproteobacteria bacterium RBG_16_64_10 TaxID=1817757 RepID=A0A1F6SW18_9PROT|nr:MAG: hypothetical protein A2V91_04265 [Candidatus Muproteobacteria bacterium RBG_16_64_10]
MNQERTRLPFPSRPRWAVGFICLFGLLATAWGAAPPETIVETANGPSLARGPRLDPIGEIRFAGNDTTKPQILLQEMLVRVGDPADAGLIEQSRQAIMDLGLFNSVRAELLPGDDRGRALLITVKEKYYILPIPKLNRNDEGDIGYGAQLRLDNLAGLNQQLKLTYEIEKADTSSSGEQEVFSVVYSYPRIFGSAYRLEVVGGRTSYPIDVLAADGTTVDASYQQSTNEAGFTVSRWLHLIGPSRGWQLGGGLVWRDRGYRYLSGTPGLYSDGSIVGLTAGIEHTDVHNYLYSRSGRTYGLSAEFGLPALGSDNNYTRQLLYYRGYYPMFNRPHHNLDVQLQLGLSSDRVFNEDAYSLGGSGTLRGYEAGSFKGNAYALANIEYLAPLFGYYPIRGVLFADIGNTYPSNRDIDLSDLKSSAGFGLRWKIKAFVKLDLRLDVAYAFDTGETRVYAGTKETF